MIAQPKQQNTIIHICLPERTVISTKAEMAPRNTVSLECLIAIIAAMKNVLSPNSDTTMTDNDATNACIKPRSPELSLSPRVFVSGFSYVTF